MTRYGPRRSEPLEVELVVGETIFAAIDFEVDQNPGSVAQYEMVVRVTDGQQANATAASEPRPAIGNPRLPTEKALYALGIVLLFGGLVLGKTVGQAVGTGPQVAGLIIVVVMFFRSFRYKGS